MDSNRELGSPKNIFREQVYTIFSDDACLEESLICLVNIFNICDLFQISSSMDFGIILGEGD